MGGAGASALAAAGALTLTGRRTDCDVCIIGSGFAGIPLAQRLVEQGLSTVVVEAGSRFASSFEYRTSGDFQYPVGAARMIAVGGTSGHWGGFTTRLMPDAFRMRSRFGDWVDWPVGYPELEPWYCEAEQFLDVTGSPSTDDGQPARSCAFPHVDDTSAAPFSLAHDARSLRFFRLPVSRRGGRPLRLADVEVPRFAASRGATFLEDRRVTDIVTRDGGSIDHVKLRSPWGFESTVSARTFIVAAGVFETPRLLLQSRSQWFPAGLGNGHGFVGRHFTYHPLFYATHIETAAAGAVPLGANRTHQLEDPLRLAHLNASNYQLIRRSSDARIDLYISPEVEPRLENGVDLDRHHLDPLGLATPQVRFSHSDRDRRSFEEAMAIGDRMQLDLGLKAALPYQRRIHSHPAGTCRMGFDAASGVVDRDLRVFGLDNLYVSGASVFPVAGTANPTATVVALTLRLADHLISRFHG